MQKLHFVKYRLLLTFCLFYAIPHAGAQLHSYYNTSPTFQNSGPIQIGLKASYLMPRNEFGMDFKRSPAYELYCQFRNGEGAGRWAARVGLFYTNLKPRLDTVPSYLIQEYPTKIFPGYIVYKKLNFIGLSIDYAYSAVHYQNLRLDVGLGVLVGQYHEEYEQAYATIITTGGNIDEYFAGLRARLTAGYQLNKYLEIYAEGLDAFVTKTDWNAQFSHTSFSIGLNISLKPVTDED